MYNDENFDNSLSKSDNIELIEKALDQLRMYLGLVNFRLDFSVTTLAIYHRYFLFAS